jgi:hypothetical protein
MFVQISLNNEIISIVCVLYYSSDIVYTSNEDHLRLFLNHMRLYVICIINSTTKIGSMNSMNSILCRRLAELV